MRKTTLLALSGYIGFIALVFWACGGHSPTSPSFGPSPVPIGPGPRPIGPAPRPIGPSPIGGGAGGGTPTPTPSGGGTPTPTPTPTVPCPSTLRIDAVGTPMLLSNATNNPALFPKVTNNYDFSCQTKEVRLTLYVTTVTGFTSPTYEDPEAQLGLCGGGPTWSGCGADRLYGFNIVPASGNALGSSCSDFAFDTTATTPWNPAAPPPAPYSGTYQLDPDRSLVGRPGFLRSLEYDLSYVFNHPPDAILQCARIDITTQVVP